ncbi:hypothetical protein KY386_01005 [Candidatus Parcubacteria bacterium]|nr:hypothetical protein [Candidatus Parcubacteria bacterium]
MEKPQPQPPELVARTAKLVPYPKRTKTVPSFATSYHYEPEGPGEESALGGLYVAIEVLTGRKQAEAVADLVIETMGEHYYNSSQPADGAAVLERFEAAVKATNQELASFTQAGHAGWVGRMSAVIAVLSGSQLHITQAGSAEAYLYRAGAASCITAGLQPKEPHRPGGTFANIASGSLQPQDRILLATPALFHHIPKNQLKTLIHDNTANAAVQKLSVLVKQLEDADRAAALVIEVTTPQLLALQARPAEPQEAYVGQPSTPLAAAKEAAAPVLSSVVANTKRLGQKGAAYGQSTLLPKTKQLTLKAAKHAGGVLRRRRGRQLALLASVLLMATLGWYTHASRQAAGVEALAKRYDAVFMQQQKAQQALAAGDKTGSRAALVAAAQDLQELAASGRRKALDRALTKRPHPENDPASVQQLQAQITAAIDRIDGLQKVEPAVVTRLDALGEAKPTHFELLGSNVILVDGQKGSIHRYNLPAAKLTPAVAARADIGRVVATTLASSGDGVYLLTAEPAVWLYRAENNSLKRQSISFGQWPKGKAIASYGGNLYILAEDGSQVYKHIPTAGGFAAKSSYFPGAAAAGLGGATSLAIDGAVYIGGGKAGLRRYIAGQLDQTARDLPEPLAQPAQIQSTADGTRLLTLNGDGTRVALLAAGDTRLNFIRQYELKGAGRLHQVRADTKGTAVYALTDGKLLKFSP